MPLQIVPQIRTVITRERFVVAAANSFERKLGKRAEVFDLAILYGKLCTECGHPGPAQACWNDNVGNRRGRSSSGRAFILPGAYEVVDEGKVPKGWRVIAWPSSAARIPGKVAVLAEDPTASQLFAAYLTLEEGTDEYIDGLGKSFPRVLRVLANEGTTPELFVEAMVADHYFTGSPAAYLHCVASIARSNAAEIAEIVGRIPEPRTFEMISRFEDYGTPLLWERPEAEHSVDPMEVTIEKPSLFDRVRVFFRRG